MGSLTTWVRTNAQHYLLRDAQARIARLHAVASPPVHGSFFWTRIFVPTYRVMPWAMRRWFMHAMPGSHRKHWPRPTRPVGPAV